jgi:thiamine kinase-like enzyme
MLEDVLFAYAIAGKACQSQLLSSGLINSTWKLLCNENEYIVQRINTGVFKRPEQIAKNLERLSEYLKIWPNYLFVGPLKNKAGKTLTIGPDGNSYRIFPYIKNSYTIDKVSNAHEAFEAAQQFGKFTSMLKDFKAEQLETTIPDFHNITLRYNQFLTATENGNPGKIKQSEKLIQNIKRYSGIVDEFEAIKHNPNFLKRVTHHDTKISNVLFNDSGKGLCVIDLDTVMPGYFFSDVGDMMRTYLSPSTEEDTDFSKIRIREDVYHAIVNGYLSHTNDILTKDEKQKFFYAGTFMIYMQALRFMTDFLNNDVYYGAKYPDHNFNRAANQVVLLERVMEKERVLITNAF